MRPKTNKAGRPRLSPEVKAARGTLRPHRERLRAARRGSARQSGDSPRLPAGAPRDYVGMANRYLRDRVAGRIVACAWVKLACERQERDLKRASDPAWPYRWSDQHATDICAFAETLPHVEGQWSTPTIRLEAWQVFVLSTLFGWRRKSDGGRRFSTCYLEVARKCAKSVLASVVALYCLHREGEVGAQVKCAATTGKQSRIVFDVCRKMVLRTPALRAAGLQVFANAIVHEPSGSSLQPINAKSSTQDGLSPSCAIIDELHAHTDRGLFDVLKSARGARKHPLSFYPTTAGYNLLGVAMEQRTFLCKVLQQIFEAEHYFGIIYTLDEADDPYDERVWIKSNPMLGVTPQLEEMRAYAREAQDSPASEGEFKTKRLNLWLSGASNWLNLAQWDACADPTARLDAFEGELACIGADLAQKDDLAALAIAFQRDGLIYGFVKFYLPRLVVEQRTRAVPAYRLWADAGVLTLTEGNTLDEGVVEADVRAWCERFDVRSVAFDQFGSQGITTRLVHDGVPAVLTPKNAKTFSEPSRDLEVRIRQGLFRHDGNAILRWNASNACVTRRIDDSLLPKKDHPDSPNKIDGIDALLLAMAGLSRTIATDDTGRSAYDEDGAEIFCL